MEALAEEIYICSLCKAFICKGDEIKNNEIPHKELTDLGHIALKKFDNLCHNLDFTKRVTLNSGMEFFSYCGVIDINCKRCKQKMGFIPVSTTEQMNNFRDKVIIMRDRLILNQVQVKHESDQNFATPFKVDNAASRKTEEMRLQRRKSLFMTKIEENIENMQQAMNKCREKYGVMFDFYKSLLTRLDAIENHTVTLQTILFNLTKVALTQKRRFRRSMTPRTPSEGSESKQKVILLYKPPKKESQNVEDVQKLIALSNQTSNKKKRRREDSGGRTERPPMKALKPTK